MSYQDPYSVEMTDAEYDALFNPAAEAPLEGEDAATWDAIFGPTKLPALEGDDAAVEAALFGGENAATLVDAAGDDLEADSGSSAPTGTPGDSSSSTESLWDEPDPVDLPDDFLGSPDAETVATREQVGQLQSGATPVGHIGGDDSLYNSLFPERT